MLTNEIAENILKKYDTIPELMKHRSLEYAKNESELFDIVFNLSKLLKKNSYPIIWDENSRSWIKTKDLLLYSDPRK